MCANGRYLLTLRWTICLVLLGCLVASPAIAGGDANLFLGQRSADG